jgi:hypothetical protein
MSRYSIRTLLLFTAIAAVVLAAVTQFVNKHRADWKAEQSAMIDGAVRWNEYSYIPNLDVGYTCTMPEWLVSWLPVEQRDIFYRVTTLDIRSGNAHPADFERCLAFKHVDTIHLSAVHDPQGLMAVLKKFTELKRICLDREFADDISQTSIPDLIQQELPFVQVVLFR